MIGKKSRAIAKTVHFPRLDTILMVEDTIKKSDEYLTKYALWKTLPRKVMYETLTLLLEYLLESNKIIVSKDNKIVWIAADSKKKSKLLLSAVKLR